MEPEARDLRTHAILGAAMHVHAVLGPGFLEAVYEEALAREFRKRAIPFGRQVPLEVSYEGRPLGLHYRPDFLCFDGVVVELKAQAQLVVAHDKQVIHYLKATGTSTGLLINFGTPRLESRRYVWSHG